MQSVNTKAHCKINLISKQVQFNYTTNKHAATFSKRQSFSYTDWAQYAVSIIMASGNICVLPIIIYIDGSTLMAIRLLQVWAQWPWTLSPILFQNELSLFSLFMTYFPWAQHCPQLNASVLDRLPFSTHRKEQCSVVSDPIQWLWATCGLVLLEVVSSLMKACESQQQLHGDGLHQEHWELVKWKLRSCSKRPLSRGIPRCHSSSLCV